MAKPTKVKSVFRIILSFLLSVFLFLFSVCLVLEATVFNPNFIIDKMNSSSYFVDLSDEITVSLTDLGFASGLDKNFFSKVVNDVQLHKDVESYMKASYSGKTSVVDNTAFKQNFNTALDSYISENKISSENIDNQSREYLVNKAAKIYSDSVRLPFFMTLSTYINSYKTPLLFATLGCGIISLAICLVLIFSCKYKHHGLKYLCYGFSGGFLASFFIPTIVLLSGKISKINLEVRSTYNLFVDCANMFFITFLVISIVLLLVSIILIFWYYSSYKKAIR